MVKSGLFFKALAFLSLCGLGPDRLFSAPPAPKNQTAWLDSVQIYSFLSIPAGQAKEYGITVNGIWNGWGCESPVKSFLPTMLHWRFRSDRGFVDYVHKGGMRHGSTISCAFASSHDFQADPELENGVCRDIYGQFNKQRGGWAWYLGNPTFMCQNHPLWQKTHLEKAERIIRAGSDLIYLDEPFGDTFFNSLPVPGFIGFSDLDLRFLQDSLDHLPPGQLRTDFGITGTDPDTLRLKLRQVDYMKWMNAKGPVKDISQADRLSLCFREIQLRNNYLARKSFVDSVRAYSIKDRGYALPIGVNLAEFEAHSTLGSIQLPILYLADLFDYTVYEMAYRPPHYERVLDSGREKYLLPPRGKWMAWHKLGHALYGDHRAIAYPSQDFMKELAKTGKMNYLCHLFAEAYAAREALVLNTFEIEESKNGADAKEKIKKFTRFVQTRKDFFQSSRLTDPVGVLYSYSPATSDQIWAYLGLAQMLYEAGIPFETIYSDAKSRRWSKLSQSQLEKYKLLIIPVPGSIDRQNAGLISDYVKAGGKVIQLDRTSLFPLSESIKSDENSVESGSMGPADQKLDFRSFNQGGGKVGVCALASKDSTNLSGNPGTAYYNGFSKEIQNEMIENVKRFLDEKISVMIPQDQREWSVLAYFQPDQKRAVLHVLNYDYDADSDQFKRKENLEIRIKNSDFGFSTDHDLDCRAFSPTRPDPSGLSCKQEGEYLTIKAPELDMVELIVITSQRHGAEKPGKPSDGG